MNYTIKLYFKDTIYLSHTTKNRHLALRLYRKWSEQYKDKEGWIVYLKGSI